MFSSIDSTTMGNDDDDDDDDGGGRIEEGSYTGDGAYLVVAPLTSRSNQAGRRTDEHPATNPKKVRVKSNHGHITVRVHSPVQHYPPLPSSTIQTDDFGQKLASVDLGGVNGSFDVAVESMEFQHNGDTHRPLSARIHVDSLSPEQVNILTCDQGSIAVTLDRKVECDLRLVSCPSTKNLDIDGLILEDDTDVVRSLMDHNRRLESHVHNNPLRNHVGGKSSSRIDIQTPAFSGETLYIQDTEYMRGRVENMSQEPDSRFDRKVKGTITGSVGKITRDGAAAQALEGFSSGARRLVGLDTRQPLIAAATDGKISLDTVSWLGAIARRYGMDESIGRKLASRKAEGKGVLHHTVDDLPRQ